MAGSEAAVIGAVVLVQAGSQAQPAGQLLDLPVMETVVQAGRAEALGGDWAAIAALPRPCPARARIRSASAG